MRQRFTVLFVECKKTELIYARLGTELTFEGFVIKDIVHDLWAFEPHRGGEFAFYHTRGDGELILALPTGIRIPVEIKFGCSVKWCSL